MLDSLFSCIDAATETKLASWKKGMEICGDRRHHWPYFLCASTVRDAGRATEPRRPSSGSLDAVAALIGGHLLDEGDRTTHAWCSLYCRWSHSFS